MHANQHAGPSLLRISAHPALYLGRSAAVRKIFADVEAFARTDEPIVVLGERGTGKTMIASYIHVLSGRGGEPMYHPLSETDDALHLDALFGHCRGAFTGAQEDRAGLVETANNGTLFLDEIGSASLPVQASLLVLFDKRGFCRQGETRRRPITARIVVASNLDLHDLAERGVFRRDLLDRLGYFELFLPPLRQRRDEILPLFRRFLSEHLPVSMRGQPLEIAPEVERLLHAAPWPGNVRQVEMVATYSAVFLQPEMPVGLDHLPGRFLCELAVDPTHPSAAPSDRIRYALQQTHGNKSQAARDLGVSRRTVQRHAPTPGGAP